MWKRIVIDAYLDHPVERVFAYLADPSKWHEFAPAVVLRHRLDPGPLRAGAQWAATDRIGPFSFAFTDQLGEHEPNRRVVWLSSAPWNARTEYSCLSDGRGTRVQAIYEGDVSGWLRVLSWVPGPIIAWFLARDFKRLRITLTRMDGGPDLSPRTEAASPSP